MGSERMFSEDYGEGWRATDGLNRVMRGDMSEISDDRRPGPDDIIRLNLGSGRHPKEGFINVDSADLPGVDLVKDITTFGMHSCMLSDGLLLEGGPDAGTVDEFHMSHVLEHLAYPLPVMEGLWYLAKPDASFTILCPHGASDDADEDPTHVRRLYPGSFAYFAAPTYWRADYGYRGDWQPERIILKLYPGVSARCTNLAELNDLVRRERNVIQEMEATLRAVKPAREPSTRDAMVYPSLEVMEAVEG